MIHLRTTLAIARKDALDILFNKATLIMLLTPVMLAILFAVLSGLLGSQPAKLLIYNPEHSPLGQVVSRSLPRSQVIPASSPGEVTSAFARGKNLSYALGMIVPPGFDASLSRGEHPQLTLYFNDNQLNEMQRQLVVGTITDYASSVSHSLPPVIITPATITPSAFPFNLDLSTFYVALALLTSISVGISLVSTLLVEEKERKTLRMLLVSPATLTDVVLGKMLVGVGYQLVLSVVVMALLRGFVGNLPLVLLFVLLITCFGLALSLLAGSIFHTTSGVGGFLGVVSLLFVLPAVFAGPLGTLFGNNLLLGVLQVLPTYYMAEGLLNALQNQGTIGSAFLDLGVTVGWTTVCLAAAVWLLHRQTRVTATI
jgi:ABC-2 type transport system permease protein